MVTPQHYVFVSIHDNHSKRNSYLVLLHMIAYIYVGANVNSMQSHYYHK